MVKTTMYAVKYKDLQNFTWWWNHYVKDYFPTVTANCLYHAKKSADEAAASERGTVVKLKLTEVED